MTHSPANPSKLKAFIVVSLLLLLCITSNTTSSQDIVNTESISIHTDIEFFVLELPDSVGEGFEPHILAGPGYNTDEEWLYIDSPTGLGSGVSGNLWISKDGGYTWEYKYTGRAFGSELGGSGDSYSAYSRGT